MPRLEILPNGYKPNLAEGEEAYYAIKHPNGDDDIIKVEHEFNSDKRKYDGDLIFWIFGNETENPISLDIIFVARIYLED